MSPRQELLWEQRTRRHRALSAMRKCAALIHSVEGAELGVTGDGRLLIRVHSGEAQGCARHVSACEFRQVVAHAWQRQDPEWVHAFCGLGDKARCGLHLYAKAPASVTTAGVLISTCGRSGAFATTLPLERLVGVAEGRTDCDDLQVAWDESLEVAVVFGPAATVAELAISCATEELVDAVEPIPANRTEYGW